MRRATLYLLLAFVACRKEPPPTAPAHRVRVLAFTETAAVRDLLAVAPYVFTASDQGVDRWDLRNGTRKPITPADGLPAGKVAAVSHDQKRGALWIASAAGLYRQPLDGGKVLPARLPSAELGISSFDGAVLKSSADGGLWVGTSAGLFRLSARGTWDHTAIADPVTAIHAEVGGDLLIGTSAGLFKLQKDGAAVPFGPRQGCDFSRVRFIAPAPDGSIIVGENGAEQRVAFRTAGGCESYRTSPPAEQFVAAAQIGRDLVVLTRQRLYLMTRTSPQRRRLTRDGVRLVPLAPAARSSVEGPYSIRPLPDKVPAGAIKMVAVREELLIGTEHLGTVRISPTRAQPRPEVWLRRSDLAASASGLSVACADEKTCYIATGTRRAWRWDGERFTDIGDGKADILAVVGGPEGVIYGLRHIPGTTRIAIAKLEGASWVDPPDFTIETPGKSSRLTFARFSSAGVLWLGLQYLDHDGEFRPYGVALVNVNLGMVAYHHASHDAGEMRKGVLPIPINVVDAAFCADVTWLATSQGAARVQGEKVDVFYESNGLLSEFLRGIACDADGGKVFVASGAGVGVYDGRSWRYPAALKQSVNGLQLGAAGRLWMATDRGLISFDGTRVRRLDARRGLLENEIRELNIDRFGRLWLLGPQGIALVYP